MTTERSLTRRLTLPLIAFLASVVALGIAFLVVDPLGSRNSSGIGGPFTLLSQKGETVTEKILIGKPTLVFFGYTHCPDVCPTALSEITLLYQALGVKADHLQTLFITVDPERDTPQFLSDYLSAFDPHILGLSGTSEAILAAEKEWRAYARKVPLPDGSYVMDHTALVYLMDKRGHFISSMNFDRPPEENAKLVTSLF